MTLVELVVALAIFALVIVSVDGSVTMLSSRSTGLALSSQAIDQLQVAEQTLVQDVHAANSWCIPVPTPAYGCATATAAPTTSGTPTLTFTGDLYGATPTIQFQLVSGSNNSLSLTMSKNGGSAVTLVSNLDPSSAFTYTKTTVGSTTYYTSIGVTLTMDSPRVGAAHVTKTTVSDSTIEVWNVEYACSITSESTGGNPC